MRRILSLVGAVILAGVFGICFAQTQIPMQQQQMYNGGKVQGVIILTAVPTATIPTPGAGTPTWTPTPTPASTALPVGFGLKNSATGNFDYAVDAQPSLTPTPGTQAVDDARGNAAWAGYLASLNQNPLGTPFTSTPTGSPTNTPLPTATCNTCMSGTFPITSAGGVTINTPSGRVFYLLGEEISISAACASAVTFQNFETINGIVGNANGVSLILNASATINYNGYGATNTLGAVFGPANGLVLKPISIPSPTNTAIVVNYYLAFTYGPIAFKDAPKNQFCVWSHRVNENAPWKYIKIEKNHSFYWLMRDLLESV